MMLILSAFGGAGTRPAFLRPTDSAWFSYIERMARGEQQALASLYDESSRLIHGVVMKILGNASDAEEVTLDVYSQIWKSAGGYSPERGSPSTWMTLLARSRALDRLRSRQGRHKHETVIEDAARAPSTGTSAWTVTWSPTPARARAARGSGASPLRCRRRPVTSPVTRTRSAPRSSRRPSCSTRGSGGSRRSRSGSCASSS